MENNKTKNSEPTAENIKTASKNYTSGNRDFGRTEEDIDAVSESEKEELEKRKQRTHEASSTPDKNHVG